MNELEAKNVRIKRLLSASSTSEGGTARPEEPRCAPKPYTRRTIPHPFFPNVHSAVGPQSTTTMRARMTTTTTTTTTRVARRVRARPRTRTRATRGRVENENDSDDATTRTRLRLRRLLARANRGVDADEELRRELERAVDALAEETKDAGANERSNGRWRLEYTTEKETLFLLGARPASTRAYQTIDGDARRLRNEVIFQSGDTEIVFTVDASIEMGASEKRVRFKFTSASIRFGDALRVPIPPFGEGWFENVYVDEDMRVSRDSRGDTLVCARDVNANE